ncbi:MAG: response regulator transcription factor [Planctomycetota bacterium]|nr:response regulator transcription factor [Planctomycetota bacterium]
MRILVVDDEPLACELFKQIIQSAGHEVAVCSDGQEAWELYRDTPFPVIVADWMMPRLDGLQLCRKVRLYRQLPYTYFIMVTGLNSSTDFLKAIDGGVDDFIKKPFETEELLARLKVAERILGIQRHIKTLEGLLPICMYCRRVKSDHSDTEWRQLEDYVAERTDANFSSTVCGNCYEAEVKPALDELGQDGEEIESVYR